MGTAMPALRPAGDPECFGVSRPRKLGKEQHTQTTPPRAYLCRRRRETSGCGTEAGGEGGEEKAATTAPEHPW